MKRPIIMRYVIQVKAFLLKFFNKQKPKELECRGEIYLTEEGKIATRYWWE
ncbi:MAG: hypothetical protein NVSMB67_30100 [Flavisolibacter sp.]